MSFQDQTLICADCQNSFTWDAKEQEFFAERGYAAPKRCKDCRQARKRRDVREEIQQPRWRKN